MSVGSGKRRFQAALNESKNRDAATIRSIANERTRINVITVRPLTAVVPVQSGMTSPPLLFPAISRLHRFKLKAKNVHRFGFSHLTESLFKGSDNAAIPQPKVDCAFDRNGWVAAGRAIVIEYHSILARNRFFHDDVFRSLLLRVVKIKHGAGLGLFVCEGALFPWQFEMEMRLALADPVAFDPNICL